MLKRVLHSQSRTLTGATAILASSAVLSGLLGVLRDRLLAGEFGASIETSIYFAAFRIPDFVYNILILGGVLIAFLPIFSEYFSKDENKAWEMTNHVLSTFLFLMIFVSSILFILAPWLVRLIAPGFSIESKAETILLTRILLIQPILLGLSNIFSGVLHYFNRFLAYSLAPLAYNIGIILGILFLSPFFGILGVALGVVIGALLHLSVQIPSVIHSGFKYKFGFDFKYPAIRKIFSLMVPRILGVAGGQLNVIVVTALASGIAANSIAIFNFSNNLQGLPIGILGASLATAAFPAFSRFLANGQKKEFVEKFSLIFRQIIFLVIPMSLLVFILRAQIVRLILGTGRFDWESTRLTAAALGLFALSIFASALIPFIVRAFFSLKNTKIPTLVTLFSVGFNVFLALFFLRVLAGQNSFSGILINFLKLESVGNIRVLALPLAFSISAIVQALLLLFFLYRKIGDFGVKSILNSFCRIVAASFLMSLLAYAALRFTGFFLKLDTFPEVLTQATFSGLIGISAYFFLSKGFKIKERDLILQKIKFIKF